MGKWVWKSRSANLFGLVRPPTPRMAVNPVRLGGLEGPNGLKMGGLITMKGRVNGRFRGRLYEKSWSA